LVGLLEREVPAHRVTVVAAPAGYGKTTLLAEWARDSTLPVAWIAVDEGNDEPARLLRSIVAAWAAIDPAIRERVPGLLLATTEPDVDAALAAMVEEGSGRREPLAFVLDDAHVVVDPEARRLLATLIERLPPMLHIVLSCREAPVPLGRARARGELLELGPEDLRFTDAEARAFLNDLMGLQLGDAGADALGEGLEGWAAGLQLVALGRRRRPDGNLPVAVTGRHRFIADYLEEDVLAGLEARRRAFLLRTSVLERLNGELCDAVTGDGDGQRMLEELERANLFLVALDDERTWYRYHRLFADVLREALRRDHPGEVAGLHRRAAYWLLERQLPEPAFDHALAAGDPAIVYQLFERYVSDFLNSGQLRTLRRWVDALPPAWIEQYPALGLAEVALLLAGGAYERSIRRIDEIERQLTEAGDAAPAWQAGWTSAVRCFMACFANDVAGAESHADRALRVLGDGDRGFRADVFHALADTYRRNGRWDEARALYLKVVEVAHQPALHVRWVHVFGALADLELMRGHLRAALDYWTRALAAVQQGENWGRVPLPVAGWVYLRMAEVFYERNALAEAAQHLALGERRAELGDEVRARIAAAVLRTQLALAGRDLEGAADALDVARSLLTDAAFPDWPARVARGEVELWLAEGRLEAAVAWARRLLDGSDAAEVASPEREILHIAAARALIAKGDQDSLGQAAGLLSGVLNEAATSGRAGLEIEARSLVALASQRRGDTTAAMTSLERALRLAEPEGYVRLFVDLGPPMGRLLQAARERHVMPGYVATLLAAFGPDAPAASRALPEPLSQRERDVLRLLAAGLTNIEIADALFISAETVKKHTGSIYAKLGVGNRTEAAGRARALGLLDDA
jgi:LuxR family maltose regulon positive regulatory protein